MIGFLIPTAMVVAQDVPSPKDGRAIVARAGGNALILFDVTGPLLALRNAKASKEETMRSLESLAAATLVERGKSLSRAQTVTLRVVYPHSPELNPKYNVTLVQTLERLMTLEATRNAILIEGKNWQGEIAAGKAPAQLKILITGKLPPADSELGQ